MRGSWGSPISREHRFPLTLSETSLTYPGAVPFLGIGARLRSREGLASCSPHGVPAVRLTNPSTHLHLPKHASNQTMNLSNCESTDFSLMEWNGCRNSGGGTHLPLVAEESKKGAGQRGAAGGGHNTVQKTHGCGQ